MDAAPENRQQLRLMLENMVDSGNYPGLCWINKEERIFRMPWYHFNDVSDADKPEVFKIFMDYAKFTNKYKEGDKPKYPDLKHTFRCAFKKLKHYFEKLVDNSKDKADPHVVYRFLNPHCSNNSSPKRKNTVASAAGASYTPNIPKTVHSLAFGEERSTLNNLSGLGGFGFSSSEQLSVFPSVPHADTNIQHDTFDQDAFALYFEYSAPVDMANPELFPCMAYDNGVMSMDLSDGAKTPSDLKEIDFSDLIPEQGPHCEPMLVAQNLNTPENSLGHVAMGKTDENVAVPPLSTSGDDKHKMILQFFYGQPQLLVMQETVGGNGCRIHFQCTTVPAEIPGLFGPQGLTQLMLPIVDQCGAELGHKQQVIISRILDRMSRGLILTFKDGDIYAQRLSRSKIFYCDANYNSISLDRHSKLPAKVFDFQHFQASFQAWVDSSGSPALKPSPHFFFTFGSEVKSANKSGPLHSVLISVSVIHCAAEEMLRRANVQTRQADDSILLLESIPDSMDQLEQQLLNMTF